MKKSMLSVVTAAVLLATMELASAQTATTTTTTIWTTDQAAVIRDYSTNRRYVPFRNPEYNPNVGMEVPGTVTLYPLPETIVVPNPGNYSYSIINDRPVIVDRSTRRIVHTWE
jgi:hypothetical protein